MQGMQDKVEGPVGHLMIRALLQGMSDKAERWRQCRMDHCTRSCSKQEPVSPADCWSAFLIISRACRQSKMNLQFVLEGENGQTAQCRIYAAVA